MADTVGGIIIPTEIDTKGITTGIKNTKSAFQRFVDSIVKESREFKGAFVESFHEAAEESSQELEKNLGKGSLFKGLASGFKGVLQGLGGFIKGFGGGLKNGFIKGFKDAKGGEGILSGLANGAQKASLSFANLVKAGLGIAGITALVKKLTGAFSDGIKNVALYSKDVNAAMSGLQASTSQFSNQIAAAAAPLVNALAPALSTIIGLATAAANAIAQLIAILTGGGTFIKAVKTQEDYAGALKKTGGAAGGAAKEAKKSTLAFDELNQLASDKSSGGGGGGGGGIDPSSMFETVEVSSAMKDFADRLRESWENADFYWLGEILGNKINDALEAIPWDKVKATAFKVGNSVATFMNGAIETIDWKLVGNTMAEGINTAFTVVDGFVSNFHWDSAGEAAGNLVNGFNEGLDWDVIQHSVEVGGRGVGTTINTTFETINWGMIGDTLIRGLRTAVLGLQQGLAQIDFRAIGHDAWEMLKGAFSSQDSTPLVNSLVELLSNAFFAIPAAIWGVIESVVTDIGQYFSDQMAEAGGFTIEGFLQGMWNAICNIGEWIRQNILIPFIKGFNNAFGIASPSKVMMEQGVFIVEGLKNGIMSKISQIGQIWENLKNDIIRIWTETKTNTINKWNEITTNLGTAWSNLKQDANTKFENLRTNLSTTWENVKQNTSETWANITKDTGEKWSNITKDLGEKMTTIKEDAKTKFEEFKSNVNGKMGEVMSYISGEFSSGWSSAFSSIGGAVSGAMDTATSALSAFRDFADSALSAIGAVISGALTSIGNAVSKAASLAKKADKIDSGERSSSSGGPASGPARSMPMLASGTVVPPRAGEFAAILGDNKHETEVVSPLSTMKQALSEALAENGGGQNITIRFEGSLAQLGRVLKPVIDSENKRVGTKLVTGGI